MTYQDKPPLKEMADELMHYGMPRRSGRFPWGSGDNPYQHSGDFLSRIDELKKQGLSEKQIAESFGLNTSQYRIQKALAKDERRALNVETAKSLTEDGLTPTEIGRKMGVNESTVRSWLNEKSEARMKQAQTTADILKKLVDEKGMIDVGAGVERELGISKEKLDQALYILEMQGYNTFGGRVPQITNPSQQTTLRILCPPDTPYKINSKGKKTSSAIYDYENIHSVKDYVSHDGGDTFDRRFTYPSSMDSKRLQIRYAEDGGIDKDGVIELRRGVQDLSLGESRYSQVRILVDGTHYMKGMALYSDDMPDGVDVIFNTNKKKGTPAKDVLKKIKDDPDNPFGSAIKDADQGGQYWYTDSKTGEKKLGLINKRADEGDWQSWSNKLPSQFLSKQPLTLARQQLKLEIDSKQAELDDILSLTNPTVKKRLLESYADDCDSAAIHLKAAALPRQKYHVIIPITSLKDNEIYAPNYKNGEQVALVRYPHGGTFEIPILTVNNKQPDGRSILGNAIDAVGINSNVAARLSGADFDGDTVMVIPTNDRVKIKSTRELEGLKGFDPKMSYGTVERDGSYYNSKGKKIKVMANTQNEMGRISNLITDMTLKGADSDELARAVRHSMVVIDAEKHKLDYKQSYIDNGIESLKKKYQEGGASTLISKAKSEEPVLKRQGTPKVNIKGSKDYDPTRPEGALLYKTADDVEYQVRKVNKRTGEVTYQTKQRTQPSTKMAETDDAYTLISTSNTPMEREYANYANKMKALANQARKEMVTAGKIEYSSSANKAYSNEVNSLMSKLNTALKNAPRERQAQTMANAEIKAKKQDNPDMTKEEIKKVSQQALSRARERVGAKRIPIEVSDKEWEAIQAGAISENKLKQILNNTDIDVIREKATPRKNNSLSTAQVNRITNMSNRGYTIAEIAATMGISTSTVSNYMKGRAD